MQGCCSETVLGAADEKNSRRLDQLRAVVWKRCQSKQSRVCRSSEESNRMKSNEGEGEGKPARWQQTTHFLCSDIRFVSGLFLIIMKEA